MSRHNILLASHGTPGARAAEDTAFGLCDRGSRILHLYVVPGFWEGMTGDDWLNNASSRGRYEKYVESQLEQEAREHMTRVRDRASAASVAHDHRLVVGDPDQCLLDACRGESFDVIVLGGRRPKRTTGLKSRMLTERLLGALPTRLLVVPYPHG